MHLEENLKMLMQHAGIIPSLYQEDSGGEMEVRDNAPEKNGMDYVEDDLTASKGTSIMV